MVVITAPDRRAGPRRGHRASPCPQVDIGTAFDAGLAIVILAIVLDRLTERAGERLARERRSRAGGAAVRADAAHRDAGSSLAVGLIAPAFVDATEFPDTLQVSFRRPGQRGLDWFTANVSTATIGLQERRHLRRAEPARGGADVGTLVADDRRRRSVSPCSASGGRRAALISAACLGVIILLGLWEHTMVTLANGARRHGASPWRSGSRSGSRPRATTGSRQVLRPLLDAAQTMPAFVYLIPAVALFGPTRFTAIVAAVIFACRRSSASSRSASATVPPTPSRRRSRPARPTGSCCSRCSCRCRPADAAARRQPGHRHGVGDGRRRRTGGRGRARLRRHRGVRPERAVREGTRGWHRDRRCSGSCSIGSPREPAADDGHRPREAALTGNGSRDTDMRDHMIGRLAQRHGDRRGRRHAGARGAHGDSTSPRARPSARPRRRRSCSRAQRERSGARPAGRRRQGHVKMLINAWVGDEANVAVVEYLLQDRWATRSRQGRSPRRSPGRASTPARSTSILENWGHPDLEKTLHHREEASPGRRPDRRDRDHRLVRPRVDGRASTPTSPTGRTSTSTPTCSRRPESGDKGQFLGGDPTFVQNDEALIANLGLNYKVVFSGSEAATITAFQQADQNKTPLSATSTTRSGSTPRSSSSRSSCRRTRRAATPTSRRSPATTRRTP